MIHNLKYLKEIRKELRNSLTPAEAVLRKSIQRRQLEGRKFRRQHSIGNFVVDFYCPSEKLVLEIDGEYHHDSIIRESDKERDKILSDLGFRVLRFENKEVFQNLEDVLEQISAQFNFPPLKEG